MFTRPQTQVGPRAAARILSAGQIPAPDSSGQASAGSDRAGAGPGHDLPAGHPEMITSWLLLYRHGFLPGRPTPAHSRRRDHPAKAAGRSPQTSDPCLQAR